MPSDCELILLDTRESSIVLSGVKDESLFLRHFGPRLRQPRELLSGEPLGSALLPYGPGCLLEPSLRITHADGNPSTVLRYRAVEEIPSNDNIRHLAIALEDPAYPVQVRAHYRGYHDEDMFESWTEILNTGTAPVTVHACASLFLPVKAREFRLTHFSSGWGQELRLIEAELTEGTTVLESIHGTQGTLQRNPSFMLSINGPAQEELGEIIAGSLCWAGNWRLTFQREAHHSLYISGGLSPFASDVRLEAGRNFVSPPMLLTHSTEGRGVVSRRFHAWARRYGLRHGGRIRPVVQNSWEGTHFDFDEEKVTTMIDTAAKLGVETFVLDDGWFGNKYPRNDDKGGLGDWSVNAAKLPRGLGHLAREAKARSMGFGIWVEPEMVNPRSELFERHPDWALSLPNREFSMQRNQCVLDLGRPEVQQFVFETLDNLLRDGTISYVKWDCNSPIRNQGSCALDPLQQEEVSVRYVHGLYAVLERLRQAYPDVVFQVCSSGGGRIDYGSLPWFDEFWTSDNTDAHDRVFIQWGTSHFFPAVAMAAHVSESPNGFTGRTTPLKFRFDVAMTGRMGIELPTQKMTPEEIEFSRGAVAVYKEIRELVQLGNLYRLVSPYESGMASLMYIAGDRARAVQFSFLLHKTLLRRFSPVRLRGLDESARYRVREINAAPGVTSCAAVEYTGDYLMKVGMPVGGKRSEPLSIPLYREFDSAVFELTRST